MSERDLNEVEQVVADMNVGCPRLAEVFTPYSQIENKDLRVSLRIGEAIGVAASMRGVDLGLPTNEGSDDWLSQTDEIAMKALRQHGGPTAMAVLKQARNFLNGSGLNGDHDAVFQRLRILKGSLTSARPGFNCLERSEILTITRA